MRRLVPNRAACSALIRRQTGAEFERRPSNPVTAGPYPPLLYSRSMTGRIGAKGQVVIPKALRDRARLQPGDEVDFELDDDRITLVVHRQPARLGGRFGGSGMAARLLEDRANEPR